MTSPRIHVLDNEAMKRSGILAMFVVLLTMPAVAVAQYPSDGGSSGGGIEIGGEGSPPGAGDQSAPGDVAIVDFAFEPMIAVVGVGETVAWTNTGNADHTVDSDTEIFESDVIDPGETYRYTFDEPGIFPYHCDFHRQMRGLVLVTDL